MPQSPLAPTVPDATPADHGARLLDDERAGLPFAEQLALRTTGALGFASFLAALPLGIISPGASWVSGGGLVALSLSVAAGAIGGWLGFQAAGLFISNPTVWRWVAMGAVLVIGGLALAGAVYIDVTDPCRNGSGTFQQCVVLP